jgi:hypothetical protein
MRTQETAQAERPGEGLAHRGGVLRGLIQDRANGVRGIPLLSTWVNKRTPLCCLFVGDRGGGREVDVLLPL